MTTNKKPHIASPMLTWPMTSRDSKRSRLWAQNFSTSLLSNISWLAFWTQLKTDRMHHNIRGVKMTPTSRRRNKIGLPVEGLNLAQSNGNALRLKSGAIHLLLRSDACSNDTTSRRIAKSGHCWMPSSGWKSSLKCTEIRHFPNMYFINQSINQSVFITTKGSTRTMNTKRQKYTQTG